ncbi:MAG: permease-like cell division protein FtsX [Oscillospiraceae bacterium]|jgi:cell division transport system permease protein|nr:permease-like cell division protein FtsX [Oscillospiraceae bacterium]
MAVSRFFSRIAYFLREGISGVFINGFMSFASIFVIAACLLITGSFALLSLNIENIIHTLEQQNKVLAFVNETYTTEQALELQSIIEEIDNVTGARFISREEAVESYLEQFDDNRLFDEITPEVLRDRYEVSLEDIAQTADTQVKLMSVPGIDKVNAYLEISRGFVMVRNIVTTVSGALIVLLLVVSMFMMSNTIRITTFTRREEIAIMRIVGATSGFIRRPFIIEGLMLGLLGSTIGYLALWALYTLADQQLANSTMFMFIKLLPFGNVAMFIAEVFGAVGIVIGVGGSVAAIRNYLKV